MKLLLTSSGLDNEKVRREFLKLLNGKIAEHKVLMIFGVRTKEEMSYVDKSKQELIGIGILRENIIDANVSRDISEKDFKKNFEVVYVCGGNTYYILDRLRKTCFDKLIKKLINKNKLYIGVSAGSIIAGPSIEIAGWGSEGDPNNLRLKNLNGLKFTNISFFPHYKERLKQEVDDFQNKVNYPTERFKDGEALVINGEEIKKIK